MQFGQDHSIWYVPQLPYQWDSCFAELRAALETLRGKIQGYAPRELQQKESWAKIVKDCEVPLKSAVARCLEWWQRMNGGYGFLVYITKFSGWKKFAKDIGKEEMRNLFGISQTPFFQRVLRPEKEDDQLAIEEHIKKKDKDMILKPMFFQRLKNSCAIFQEEGPQWLMEGCDENVENLATAILWLYSPMKLQKDCLVTLRPACQFSALDPLWRHEDKGYVFNTLARPGEFFFEQQHPADLMPDKTRLPKWKIGVLENPQGDPFAQEQVHDSGDMVSASVPEKTLVIIIHDGVSSSRKRQKLRGWPELYEDEWEEIQKKLQPKDAASNQLPFFRMGNLLKEPQPGQGEERPHQNAVKFDWDALQKFIYDQRHAEGKLSEPIVSVNITKLTTELHIPEIPYREPVQSESIGELRRRLADKCGIGKTCLLLSQGKDGRRLLQDDEQLERLLMVELKRKSSAGNTLREIKIEINYLKGFDHPNILRLKDLVVHGASLPHWRSSTATLRGPVYRAAAARAALIDVASALRHLHQNGWGHMDVQPCNLQITGQVQKPNSVDLKLCLVDAGSAALLKGEVQTWNSRYALPEVRSGDSKTRKKAFDWFALGMTVKDLAEGLWPQVILGEETPPLTLVEAAEETELHQAASASASTELSLVAFPEGSSDSVERLTKADSFLVSDAVQPVPGLKLQNFHTDFDTMDEDGNLIASRERILKKVRENGRILESLPSFHGMEDVVMAAVQQTGWALQFADAKLCGHRDIVLAAVRRDGQALEFASEQLREDRDVVLAAVKNSGWALEFASKSLRQDVQVVAEAVRWNPWALELSELRNHRLTWEQPPRAQGAQGPQVSTLPLNWAALKL